jgi:hypothetical protein
MKVRWTFFAGLAGGFALIFAITAGAFWLNLGAPTAASQWAAEVNRKHLLLADKCPSPKLLLVGGSATLFGISAREIQNETRYPTVNVSTHAALGPDYILYLAKQAAKPGDTVLLTFEYSLYSYRKIEWTAADDLMLDYVVSRDPAFFRTLSPGEKWNVFMLTSSARLVRGIKGRWRRERPPSEQGVYKIENINEWGDQTQHIRSARPQFKEVPLNINMKLELAYGIAPDPPVRPLLAGFCAWARANNVRVLATFPNAVDQSEYYSAVAKQSVETIRKLYSSLGVPVLGDYTDALRPADEFFDTHYHLSEEAAVIRSRKLAEQLKPFLNQKVNSSPKLNP